MKSCNISFYEFDKRETLVEALAQNIAKNLQDSIDKNSKASLIVSGGSTPKPLFKRLREIDIEWNRVSVGLCDERWVEVDHKDSNEKLVKDVLLQKRAKEANFIGMYEDKDIQRAVLNCSKKIEKNLFPFDVVILGMGLDAHTASLFPENSKLKEAFDMTNSSLCIAIEPQTASHMRMSLTLKAILSAKNLYLHFEGDEKLKVYKEAISGDDFTKMPIRSILHQNIKEIEVYYR